MKLNLRQLAAIPALLILLLLSMPGFAQEVPAQLREKLTNSIVLASQNQLQIESISTSPLPEIFEVELSTGEILYSHISGDYLFAGDLYQTSPAGLVNLSADTRALRNLAKVEAIPESEMIIYTPDEIKATITVFTDVDCTYCRALHREIDDILALGVQVRYVAYPRGGEAADSYQKMISVWCSEDRHKTLTQAKNGQNLPARDCQTPILAHYEIGNELGISGTPALIFPDGRVIPGYVESARLAEMLNLN